MNMTIKDEYVLYTLATSADVLVYFGIARFKEMTISNGFFEKLPDERLWLQFVKIDHDREILMNEAIAMVNAAKRPDLREGLRNMAKSWNEGGIECIETGEVFPSAKAAATAHDLTYGQLLKHLKGEKSFNTVKGRTYRKVVV